DRVDRTDHGRHPQGQLDRRPGARRVHRVRERAEPLAEALRDHRDHGQDDEESEVHDGRAAQGEMAEYRRRPVGYPKRTPPSLNLRDAAHRVATQPAFALAWVAIPSVPNRVVSSASQPPRSSTVKRTLIAGNPFAGSPAWALSGSVASR